MNAYLIRQYYKTHTAGTLIVDGNVLYTLERPWLNNRSNVSCVPSGTYKASFLPMSASGKYRQVWHLSPTSPRTGILIHNGNLVSHSKGCLLIGTHQGRLANLPAVLGSRAAMRKLRQIVGLADFTLHIVGDVSND